MTGFCVCSSLLSDEAVSTLRNQFRVIKLPPDNALAAPIQCHPDSIFAVIGDEMIVPAEYYGAYPAVIDEIASLGKFRLTLTDAPRSSVYPADAAVNVAVGRDFLLCRPDIAAPEILQAADRAGLNMIPVRQGYAGCASLITDGGVLTFDPGIARALDANGIPNRLLTSGGIALPGYGCGFFGGTCGFHDGVITVNGDPATLPCAAELSDFAHEHGFSLLSLCSGKVTDVGGIRFYGN